MENNGDVISPEFLILIITATLIGALARIWLIKLDYRQYPSYPNGYLIHMVTGILAAALGAFIVPALMTANFTAVTFLGLAIQQFREVRKIERESLLDLEGDEYTSRGDAYIDGISKIFESRNYIALIVSFAAAITIQLIEDLLDVATWMEVVSGLAVGAILFLFLKHFTKRQKLRDIATVTQGEIELIGSELYVDGMLTSNLIGVEEGKQWVRKEGIAAVIHPTHDHFKIPLINPGQRQAILFEAARRLGQKKIYSFQNPSNGKIIIAIVPIINNFDLLKETISITPVLETVKKSPELLKGKGGD